MPRALRARRCMRRLRKSTGFVRRALERFFWNRGYGGRAAVHVGADGRGVAVGRGRLHRADRCRAEAAQHGKGMPHFRGAEEIASQKRHATPHGFEIVAVSAARAGIDPQFGMPAEQFVPVRQISADVLVFRNALAVGSIGAAPASAARGGRRAMIVKAADFGCELGAAALDRRPRHVGWWRDDMIGCRRADEPRCEPAASGDDRRGTLQIHRRSVRS